MQRQNLRPHDLERESLPNERISPEPSGRYCYGPGEKPSLACHVRRAGKLSELGFQDPQWLLDNGGKFIQVTELLYRIAEYADGEHTLKEIAARVTNVTEWSLDAADVEYLIESKLAPLGLIENAAAAESQAASPLAINLKFRTLGPRVTEKITSVLHFLCNSLIVVLALGAAAATRLWLYLHHGLAASIQDVIYTPGGLLFALGMVLLGAVLHEFGHASALRHHGGRVGNMGVGFYIIYPVLYTDVSDNYRLSRRARISTDLGGVYFHILFSLALFGAYLTTHRELLLFAVLLIDLEILEQFVPFARLDGYWLLCDLAGIPDFFSQMTPFLHAVLPPKLARKLDAVSSDNAGQHEKLPAMKTGAKAAFAAYIAVTIPFLIYVFVRMIISLPDLISEMWTGLHIQTQLLSVIDIRKDPLTTALVILQIIFLVLPVPATLYFLYITLRPAVERFVHWATHRPRKAFATAGVLCCGITVALVVAPSVRVFRHIPEGPRRAQELLQKTQQATAKLSSMAADFEGTIGEDHYTGKLILKRPNFARVEINGTKGLGKVLLVSDGSIATTYFPETNEFAQAQPGNQGQFIQSTVLHLVDQFFTPQSLDQATQLEYMGHRVFDGNDYDVVQFSGGPGAEGKVNYFISRADNLVHRTVEPSNSPQKSGALVVLNDVKTNIEVNDSTFAWNLPQGARQLQLPSGVRIPVK